MIKIGILVEAYIYKKFLITKASYNDRKFLNYPSNFYEISCKFYSLLKGVKI